MNYFNIEGLFLLMKDCISIVRKNDRLYKLNIHELSLNNQSISTFNFSNQTTNADVQFSTQYVLQLFTTNN